MSIEKNLQDTNHINAINQKTKIVLTLFKAAALNNNANPPSYQAPTPNFSNKNES